MGYRRAYRTWLMSVGDVIDRISPLEKIMSDDKNLKQAVLDELAWDPSVNAAHIGVTAKDGGYSYGPRRKLF
jgi:hypothetical protein